MTSNEMAKKLAEIGHAIAPETVRKDWAKGAPREDPARFLKWRAKHIPQDGRSDPDAKALKAKKTQREIELLDERLVAERRENAVRAGLLWPKADVIAARRASAEKVRAVLDAKLRVELPARCAGRSADEIGAEIGAALDLAYQELAAS